MATLRWASEEAKRFTGELLRLDADPGMDGRLGLVRRFPLGVVLGITPFNFPIILSIRAVAPALALGNSVILKPDPRTAICGGVVLARIFEEAGLLKKGVVTFQQAFDTAPLDRALKKIGRK